MSALWRGSWATRARIATGLILFTYVVLHFLNIGLAVVSPDAADRMQDVRGWIVRSLPGTVLLYGALGVHAVLALGKVALARRLRFAAVDVIQVGFGVTIPLLLVTHVVFTRASHAQFDTHDTVGYISGLIWTTSSGWLQALLLLLVWVHGCLGLHMWLKLTRWWRQNLPSLGMVAALLPAFALAGFASEGRRVQALLWGDEAGRVAFFDATNWPAPEQFAALYVQRDVAWWIIFGLLCLAFAVHVVRRVMEHRQKSLTIAYVDGPVVSTAPGPTLLEISQGAGVAHMALCGGRGRCTTCRVIVQEGQENMPPASEAEIRALDAAKAPEGARLACQMRPQGSATVYRMFRPDGRTRRSHASQGKEAQLAVLFLDMRGFTSRTTGQLPYDVVHLLNRFFDAIVPPITAAGGTVDKYLGDGLLALFEMPEPAASARAGLTACREIGHALDRLNADLADDGTAPVRIGLSLHLGYVVLGEIGAAGHAPRTLIGDTVNTASRLEAETKRLKVEALISEPLLEAAGIDTGALDFEILTLRGVTEPLRAHPVKTLATIGFT